MTTPPAVWRDEFFELIEADGFDRKKDADIFEWAERWALSNQLLPGPAATVFDLFTQSYGWSLYLEHGVVPDDED